MKTMNVFEFCLMRKNAKMSTKDLLLWLDIDLPYGEMTEIDGRYIRRIGNGNLLQLSCPVRDFDRWALSGSDIYFDLELRSDRRRFIRYVEEIRSTETQMVA